LKNRLWIQTVSHKALRLFIPLLLLIAPVANLWLLDEAKYAALLIGQATFYGAAFMAHYVRGVRRVRLLGVPYVVCLLAWATVLGFFRILARTQTVTWAKPAPEAR
jgi:hypothetical protein